MKKAKLKTSWKNSQLWAPPGMFPGHREAIAIKREIGEKTWRKPRHEKKAYNPHDHREWHRVTDYAL